MPDTFFGWIAFLWEEYAPLFIRGTGNTLLLAVSGTAFGFVIGLLVAILRTVPLSAKDKPVRKCVVRTFHILVGIYIEVFRGTPMIVQAMVLYYGLLQSFMPAMGAAVFIISLNTGAYMAEILRGGIIAVDKGQKEAAQAIGMTHWQSMCSVVLPQAVRNALPSIGNEFIVNIKDSSVLNVISVSELFFQGKSASGTYLRYYETFFIVALIYLVLTFLSTRLIGWLERKLDGPDSFVIHGSQSDSRAVIRGHKEG